MAMHEIESSDLLLESRGLDRQWVGNFWGHFTPAGRAIVEAQAYGCEPDHVADDWLFTAMVLDVQRYVYGDEGDESVGDFISPATPEELTGIADDRTINRMLHVIDDDADENPETRHHELEATTVRDAIVYNGVRVPVEGVYVVSLDEEGGTSFRRDAKRRKKGRHKGGPRGVWAWPKAVKANLAAGHGSGSKRYATVSGTKHWTAGQTAPGGIRALKNQGYATTKTIDIPSKVDGRVIVYQTLDPALDRGIHAGNPANRRSFLSTDYANPAITKWAARQEKRTGIPRPLIRADYHGRRKRPFMGAYRDQIIADLRLSRAFCELGGFLFAFQVDADGRPMTAIIKDLWTNAARRGFHLHLHLTRNKWDVAGLVEQIAVLLLTDAALAREFPELVRQLRLHDPWWVTWLDELRDLWRWSEVWSEHAA